MINRRKNISVVWVHHTASVAVISSTREEMLIRRKISKAALEIATIGHRRLDVISIHVNILLEYCIGTAKA